MNSNTALMLAVGGAALIVAVVAIVWWLNRSPSDSRDGEVPLFSVGMGEAGVAPAPRRARPVLTPVSTPVVESPAASPVASPRVAGRVAAPPAASVPPAAVPPVPAPAASVPPAPGAAVSADGVPGTMVEGHQLRFSVPQEGTLQFLPGRLEILSGQDAGRDIRFVRVPGPQGTEVTFGRSEGPLYRHIQLREATVSRSHARLRLLDGRWHLLNLSATNPVVHNSRQLGESEEQPLDDGDRIEMGEVVFGFRSR